MSKDEATALLAAALREIAPEVNISAADPDIPLQEVADIDSRDFLTLIAAISNRADLEIAPRDYPNLATPRLIVSYLMSSPRAG